MGAEETETPAGPPMPPGPATTRLDRWLWAVRLVKTRADAAQACRGGHVKVNDRAAKPATTVKTGDEVKVRLHGRDREVTVTYVLDKRVGAPVAVRCYSDHSPPAPERLPMPTVPRRDPGAGRPTKRDRRRMDRLREGG